MGLRANTLHQKNEEGIEYIEKNKTGLNFDTAGNKGLTGDAETIRYRKKDKLSDRLTPITDKNKTTTGVGVNRLSTRTMGSILWCECQGFLHGTVQKVRFNEPATYDKIKG